jgi:NAD(P)-dependent dehydrogenase (short-subunit alcohol dehydrogenase family)
MRAVVTGANRGIGLELARQLIARGDEVIGGVRDVAAAKDLAALGARAIALDVADGASVAAFAREVGDAPIDLLVNNAGVNGGSAQNLGALSSALALEDVINTFQINAAGALRVSVALLPNLRRGTGKKIVSVTSGMGSIADNGSGGWYAYRMSKAALNMMSMSLAVDLKPEGILSVVINPGFVQTDMGGPRAPTPVDESVRKILEQIDKVTLADTGAFLNWKGNRYPW